MSELRTGFVAIVGRPNVGKSTVMNHLIGMKIAAVSKRAQTTRKKIQTIYTDERGQIVFLDTPGINRAETKLGEYMIDAAADTLKTADLIIWVVEPSVFIGKGERKIAEMIAKAVKGEKNLDIPVFLLVNKTDTCEEGMIDKAFETYKAYVSENEGFSFSKCLHVSATKGDNMEDLRSEIFKALPVGPLYYDEDEITDETEREIAAEYIREKCLRNLNQEIPHGIAVIVDKMKTRDDGSLVDIDATIICEREGHKGIIIGKKGSMLRKIGTEARRDIEDMLQMHVNLKLYVKVRPGWRDNKNYMNEYGYK